MRYGDRFQSVTVIQRRAEGEIKPWGNGIFVKSDERAYLVTCRHLVRSDLPMHNGEFDLPEQLFLRLKLSLTGIFENCKIGVLNPRRWRTTASLKNLVDIVAIELPDDLQLKFNIVFWKPTDLATKPPNIGTKIHILEHFNDVNEEPAYNDISASMGNLQPEGQAFIDNAIAHISFGHSGSLVYRFVHCNDAKHEVIDEARIQAVGLIVGAKKIGGSRPEMVLLDRVLPILALWEDYLDESGIVIINH